MYQTNKQLKSVLDEIKKVFNLQTKFLTVSPIVQMTKLITLIFPSHALGCKRK